MRRSSSSPTPTPDASPSGPTRWWRRPAAWRAGSSPTLVQIIRRLQEDPLRRGGARRRQSGPTGVRAGWEDAAVPPERLGDYLRDLEELLQRHGLAGLPYGHFGDGCVHCRIDFPLTQT